MSSTSEQIPVILNEPSSEMIKRINSMLWCKNVYISYLLRSVDRVAYPYHTCKYVHKFESWFEVGNSLFKMYSLIKISRINEIKYSIINVYVLANFIWKASFHWDSQILKRVSTLSRLIVAASQWVLSLYLWGLHESRSAACRQINTSYTTTYYHLCISEIHKR